MLQAASLELLLRQKQAKQCYRCSKTAKQCYRAYIDRKCTSRPCK